MLPCNFTSENYILIIVFKYNNYNQVWRLIVISFDSQKLFSNKNSWKKVWYGSFFCTTFIIHRCFKLGVSI